MIGLALIEKCVNNGEVVLAIVRPGTNRLSKLPKSEYIQIEYADLNALDKVCGDGYPYDVFYHLAWSHTEKSGRDLPMDQEDNVHSTLRAVELAKKLGCNKFVGAGSQAEYGQVKGVISADTRTEPLTAYGIAKLSANMFSRKMCEQYEIQHIWGRIFSVYGCNDHEGTMLNYAIKQFAEGRVAKFSAATHLWNYLNEKDAGSMFYLLGVKNVESGIYCIANTESRVLREYIEEVAKMFDGDIFYEFAEAQSDERVVELNVDMEKTVNAIEFEPQISFAEGIKELIYFRKRIKQYEI